MIKDIKELKEIIKGNSFQESHGSTTMVIVLDVVLDLIDDLELVKNNVDLADVRLCAKCNKNEDGFGLRGELCSECDHLMRLDAM